MLMEKLERLSEVAKSVAAKMERPFMQLEFLSLRRKMMA
jgi:adenine deaminase